MSVSLAYLERCRDEKGFGVGGREKVVRLGAVAGEIGHFTTPDSIGVMRVAAFLARQGDATFLAAVAGFVRELVRSRIREQ